MASAGCRLDEGGVNIREVLDLENLVLGVGAVLGEATGQSRAMAAPLLCAGNQMSGSEVGGRGTEPRSYVLAEQGFASAAVEAVAAQLRVVGSNAVPNLEALDVLQLSFSTV